MEPKQGNESRWFRASRRIHAAALVLVLVAACARSKSHPHGPSGAAGAGAGSGGVGQTGGRGGGAGAASGAGRDGSAGDEPGQGGDDHGGAPGQGGSETAGSAGHPVAGASANSGGGHVGGQSGSGGLGGGGGQAPLPLPEGCEPRMRTEGEAGCSLGVFCGADPNLIDCQRIASGRWQCTCELENNARVYEIDGAPGLASCAVAAGLCSLDELDLGEETCTERSDTSDENYCAMEVACERPIAVDFAPDVDAWLMEYRTAECLREGSSHPFECSCDHDEALREFGLLAETGELACRPLIDFCRTAVQPTFDGENVCFDTEASSSDGSCVLSQACVTPMRLTDDVSLASVVRRAATCDEAESTSTYCYCSKQTDTLPNEVIGWETFSFDVAAGFESGMCGSAVLNCSDDAVIELEGDVDCQPTSQNAGDGFCTADLDCRQAARVDGRAIVGRGRLGVYCRQAVTGAPWFCSCASDDESTILELGVPQSTGWQACTEAPTRCLEQMSVVIGPYGEYVAPPDPLPPEQ
jgi:hypothetical protein